MRYIFLIVTLLVIGVLFVFWTTRMTNLLSPQNPEGLPGVNTRIQDMENKVYKYNEKIDEIQQKIQLPQE